MEKLKKILLGASTLGTSLVVPCVSVFASDSTDLNSAFTTALGTVKTDFMTYASSAIPVALSIAGIVLAISLGWKLFKKFAK